MLATNMGLLINTELLLLFYH